MKEVEFKDRVPSQPGKIRLIPVEGQRDIFIMERADEPIVEGTPLNKATFNSIVQSRLTGRFYDVTAFTTLKNSTSGKTTPLPTSGWTVTNNTSAVSSIYKVVASSAINSEYSVEKAVDGKDSTSWGSLDGTEHSFTVTFPIALSINKIRLNMGRTGTTTGFSMSVQGSNDGTIWTNLSTFSGFPDELTEYTLSKNTGDYSQFRLLFAKPDGGRVYIESFEITDWAANSYTVDFITSGMPTKWDNGQRVSIQVPIYAAFVVDSNTFNGVKVNTILLSGRRYDLRYNGTSFDAKEV